MPIDTVLIQLADLVGKIENTKALLVNTPESVPLTSEDRELIEGMLVRLNRQKVELEDQLRGMVRKPE